MKHKTALIFFLLTSAFLFSGEAFAQKFLALDKHGRIKRFRFNVNDQISIRLNDEIFFCSGYIDAFTDTSFFLDGNNIPLSKINAVYIHKTKGGHALLRQLVSFLPAGGAFIMGLAAGNSLINKEYPLIPKSTLTTAAGMAAAGLLLYPLTFRVYKTKHHPLKIIDVTISTQH